jgi:Uma2 family endonuclease
VIEVRSPDDRLSELASKMEEYMANGVQLGWLIYPIKKTALSRNLWKGPDLGEIG